MERTRAADATMGPAKVEHVAVAAAGLERGARPGRTMRCGGLAAADSDGDGSCSEPLLATRWDSEESSDVTFYVGPGPDASRVPAQRAVLAAASPVLAAMLAGPLAEGPNVHLKDVERRAFDNLLRFAHGERLHLQSVDTALSTLYAAHKYHCEPLEHACLDYLSSHLDTSTVLPVRRDLSVYCKAAAAPRPSAPPLEALESPGAPADPSQTKNLQYGVGGDLPGRYRALLEECLRYIDLHAERVLEQEELEELERAELLELARRDTLQLGSELSLFLALDRWARCRCQLERCHLTPERRRAALGDDLLFSVRFLLMSSEEFLAGPMMSKLLTPDEGTALLGRILRHAGVPEAPQTLGEALPAMARPRRPPPLLPPARSASAPGLGSKPGAPTPAPRRGSSLRRKKSGKKQQAGARAAAELQEQKPNMSDYFFGCIACIFD